jgi:hypothetical protein
MKSQQRDQQWRQATATQPNLLESPSLTRTHRCASMHQQMRRHLLQQPSWALPATPQFSTIHALSCMRAIHETHRAILYSGSIKFDTVGEAAPA